MSLVRLKVRRVLVVHRRHRVGAADARPRARAPRRRGARGGCGRRLRPRGPLARRRRRCDDTRATKRRAVSETPSLTVAPSYFSSRELKKRRLGGPSPKSGEKTRRRRAERGGHDLHRTGRGVQACAMRTLTALTLGLAASARAKTALIIVDTQLCFTNELTADDPYAFCNPPSTGGTDGSGMNEALYSTLALNSAVGWVQGAGRARGRARGATRGQWE